MSNTIIQDNETNSETRIQNSFEVSEYITKRINSIKAEHEKQNTLALNSNDKIKTCIIEIAEYMETQYNEFGLSILVDQISINISKLLKKKNLNDYVILAFKVLPEKYKDKNHDKWKNAQREIIKNKFEKIYKELDNLNISILSSDDLYEIKDKALELVSRPEEILKLQGFSPTRPESTQLNSLDEAEKQKFQPAKVGEPATEAEKLCQDPEYLQEYDGLVKELNTAIKIAEFNKYWFTKYIPLSVESCRKLKNGFYMWNKWWQPYSDKKYRRDHSQLAQIVMTKINETSVKASKESRIPCMWHVDKQGKPILRGLTKEQIDAMYVWETNFLIEMVNHSINFGKDISDVNAEHGSRCNDDRAVALHEHLAHHA